MYLFFIADTKKIICKAIINGIKGIFQLILTQLIFIKNKMMDVITPAVIIMKFGLVELALLVFVKLIFWDNDFGLLIVFIVGFFNCNKNKLNKNSILTGNRKGVKKRIKSRRKLYQTQIFGDGN